MEEDRLMDSQIDGEEVQFDNKLRPSQLREYVGQEKIKENLKIFISAAKMRNESLDHVLIFGPPGLGKTHLLQAIGNHIVSTNPNMRVVYLTSEKFMLDFITSIQKNHSTEFISHYRNVDMVLLDDAHAWEIKC